MPHNLIELAKLLITTGDLK